MPRQTFDCISLRHNRKLINCVCGCYLVYDESSVEFQPKYSPFSQRLAWARQALAGIEPVLYEVIPPYGTEIPVLCARTHTLTLDLSYTGKDKLGFVYQLKHRLVGQSHFLVALSLLVGNVPNSIELE
jgi:hypothetical protein